MRTKLRKGQPAEITFTSDFHELLAGDLHPGGPLLLRYDPRRIVPADEPYRFGDPERPVIAHLRFRADGPGIEVVLRSPAGIVACPDADVTGQGSMLSARLDVPADADRVVVWFSYDRAAGGTVYDSDFGADYRFGFPAREIRRVEATVVRHPDTAPDAPGDRLEVTVATPAGIEAVAVKYTLIADPGCAKHEVALQRTGEAGADGDTLLWQGSADVPNGAIVRFKVCYWIEGRRLIDDNAGAHYLAPAPAFDRPPPPPAALIEAAAAWR